ncbi:hypothetical protein AWB77_00461 [Caballeronia fortuita]|uniref:ABC-three component systems C-terminal domain-containing protein n=1 Tax=Caballeronia fortuita TaxID=1777138 RepID=A0A157ZAE5_9BURK|nr:ABC-three component system protein [Caballeronia fortuita]SAK42516.1 hypothetical protein AWB77_00461 [Caballeronia fortuita]
MKNNSVYVIEAGAHAPVAQLRLLDSAGWEQFVEECCLTLEGKGKQYEKVKRLGMPGDKGRDVEALMSLPRRTDGWDIFQCKFFKDPLAPSNFFPEMAKFFEHIAAKSYPQPRTYFLCGPQDCGIRLHDYLVSEPEDFKAAFIDAWRMSKQGLKGTLTPEVLAAIEAFDFARFKEKPCRELVEMHSANEKAHYKRFGIKPKRPADPRVPKQPLKKEERYVQALLSVYSEHANRSVPRDELVGGPYEEHFAAARSEFFSVEGLKRFSRDIFAEEFDRFLDVMHTTVRSEYSLPTHENGFQRLRATTTQAHKLVLGDSPLNGSLNSPDYPGACHHLANAGKLKWVKKREG